MGDLYPRMRINCRYPRAGVRFFPRRGKWTLGPLGVSVLGLRSSGCPLVPFSPRRGLLVDPQGLFSREEGLFSREEGLFSREEVTGARGMVNVRYG